MAEPCLCFPTLQEVGISETRSSLIVAGDCTSANYLPIKIVCEVSKWLLGSPIVSEQLLCGLHRHVLILEKKGY